MRIVALACLLICSLNVQEAQGNDMLPIPLKSLENPLQQSGAHLGIIEIPSLNLHEPVYAGVHADVLAKGVGHWAGSAWSSEGNMILAAHRVFTVGQKRPGPFYALNEILLGDLIYTTPKNGKTERYRVYEIKVVHESEVKFVTSPEIKKGAAHLTLFTCDPPGENEHRLVVRGIKDEFE